MSTANGISGLSMNEPVEKLKRLEETLPPGTDPMIIHFGRFLSTYLVGLTLTPCQFLVKCEMSLCDLANGVTSINTDTKLPTQSKGLYMLFHEKIPIIAGAIFSKEYAKEVISVFHKLNHRSK